MWRWREDYGGQIIEQLKRLGASLDYDDERFTLDDRYARAVQDVFVTLYEKGYIYRDRYLVNWDPGSRSAISDLEVEDREAIDTLYYIDYPLATGSGAITVATVRPETMLADTAIAVNPADERYARLVGEKAILPLVGRKLKIIADEYVKPDFGTGALKITPGHDPNDFEIGRRHGLAQISVIGEDGRITAEAPDRFVGMTVAEARAEVVAELRREDLIARTEEYVHEVPYSQRSGERIEPLISLQWFMRMDELVKPAIEVVGSGRVRFWPENYTRVYMNWMENIRPWVISRQLWWGHRIPVWYRGDDVYVGLSEPEGEGWERDPTCSTRGSARGCSRSRRSGGPRTRPRSGLLPDRRPVHRARHHLPLGRADDHARDRVHRADPVRGRIRPLDHPGPGRTPDVQVARHRRRPAGPDRRRPAAAGVCRGRRLPGIRRRCRPLGPVRDVLRAGRALQRGQARPGPPAHEQAVECRAPDPPWRRLPDSAGRAERPAAVEDRWILSRLERARTQTAERIERFDFAHAALGVYEFVYGELCDWYLELVKPRLRAGERALGETLLYVLTQTLAIAHPMIPFVTEEIYRYIPGSEGLLAAGLPEVQATPVDETAEASVARVIEAVQALRGWRDFAGVRAAATVPARLAAEGYEDTGEHLARLARVAFTSDGAEPVASVPVPGGTVEILPSDEVDLEGAERRLAARRAKLEAEIERAERKLANQGFVDKAPPEVVQAERDKLKRLKDELDSL